MTKLVSLLLGIHALGLITQCIAKVNLLLNVTQLLLEVTRMGFGHFQPFFAVLVGFEGAMRSYFAGSRPPDIKLRSSLV